VKPRKARAAINIVNNQAAVPPVSAAIRGKFRNIFVQIRLMMMALASQLPKIVFFFILSNLSEDKDIDGKDHCKDGNQEYHDSAEPVILPPGPYPVAYRVKGHPNQQGDYDYMPG
jgi:hypothetical protein